MRFFIIYSNFFFIINKIYNFNYNLKFINY